MHRIRGRTVGSLWDRFATNEQSTAWCLPNDAQKRRPGPSEKKRPVSVGSTLRSVYISWQNGVKSGNSRRSSRRVVKLCIISLYTITWSARWWSWANRWVRPTKIAVIHGRFHSRRYDARVSNATACLLAKSLTGSDVSHNCTHSRHIQRTGDVKEPMFSVDNDENDCFH